MANMCHVWAVGWATSISKMYVMFYVMHLPEGVGPGVICVMNVNSEVADANQPHVYTCYECKLQVYEY